MPPTSLKLLHPVISPGEAAQRLHEESPLSAVACSPDGRLLALGGHRGLISIRDARSGAPIRRLTGHTERIHECVFSPDSRWLLSASLDGSLRRWSMSTGESECIFTGTRSLNTCDCDGVRAVTAGDDGRIRLWDGQEAVTLTGHPGMVTTVALHPDGHRLISGGIDGTIRLWDPTDLRGETLYQHAGAVTAATMTPDGAVILSAGTEGRLVVWDLRRGRKVGELSGHSGPITSCAISPEGRLAVSGAIDRTVMTWDLRTGTCKETFTSHSEAIMSVAWGSRIWSASEDGTARAWEPGQQAAPPSRQLRHLDAITDARISGDQLLTVSTDCTLRAWDVGTGECMQVIDGALGPLGSVDLTASQRILATAGGDGFARIYRRDERWEPGLVLPTGPITTAAFLSEHTLVTGGPEQAMQAWSLLNGCPLFTMGETGVSDFVVLPGGEIVSVDDRDAPIFWSGGEAIKKIGAQPACAIAAHPDGVHLVLGRTCGSVEVWRLHDDAPLFAHTPHDSPVTALAIMEDGRVISAATDEPVVLWDPQDDHLTGIPTHGTIQTITVKDTTIAAGDDAGNVWLFSVSEASAAEPIVSMVRAAA
jgi:WD40 repeat protein